MASANHGAGGNGGDVVFFADDLSLSALACSGGPNKMSFINGSFPCMAGTPPDAPPIEVLIKGSPYSISSSSEIQWT